MPQAGKDRSMSEILKQSSEYGAEGPARADSAPAENSAMIDGVNEEQRRMDVINVLASEYNAVYYCDALTHDYDICFQQGFVREEILKMLKLLPKYEDGFTAYINNFVHPDDREMMFNEISMVDRRLKNRKSYKVDFRRLYGDKYLYTKMNCVKVGEENDELKFFVVGFAENDAEYHRTDDQRRQLEYAVTERTSELQERNRTLNRINESIIELLGNITEARDTESGEHIRRVKGFTNILARQMQEDWPELGISNDFIALMTSASALHDIGKIMIPDAILLKPGKLTPEEYEIMKTHCVKGAEVIKKAPSEWSDAYIKTSMDIVLYHHEKYDGNGYPKGLKGDAIPLSAQIVSVADCFDALTAKRVYKEAYDNETAFRMIMNGECGAFSEKLLRSFSACRREMFAHASDLRSVFNSDLPAGISTESLSWTRLLLVEDNDMSRELGQEILESEGANVVAVPGGREAIDAFLAAPQDGFDAILMDVIMPEMSGVEAAQAIRALDRPDAKTVPIIALTSLATDNDINNCLDAGMDSFITKPISVQNLNKVLYECFQRHYEALDNAVMKAGEKATEKLDSAIRESPELTREIRGCEFLCYVDGNTNDVQTFRYDERFGAVLSSISSRLPSNRRLDRFFRAIIPQYVFDNFLFDVGRYRVETYLTDHLSYHTFVRVKTDDGGEELFRLIIAKDELNAGGYIIGLQSLDTEMREAMETREIIMRLSSAYEVVDYVDLDADTFTRYNSRSMENFGPEKRGCYSELLKEYLATGVAPGDVKLVEGLFNLDHLRRTLKTRPMVSARYKDIQTGTPRYFEMQMIEVGRKDKELRAVLTVSNIDELVQRERESNKLLTDTRRQLVEAERRANCDTLTGVKNITAYTDVVAELSRKMNTPDGAEFGLVLCDINHLKSMNDTRGHDIGDEYIRNCCRIICDVFKRSPVYRIGGDEFTVILRGHDYENRTELIRELRNRAEGAEKLEDVEHGYASFAAGMSEYLPGDTGVSDVFKRADIEMYASKHKDR